MSQLRCSSCGSETSFDNTEIQQNLRCSRCGHALAEPDTKVLGSVAVGGTLSFQSPTEIIDAVDQTVESSERSSLPQQIGRFLPKSILGQGAFGRVYLAFDPSLERDVALKVPRFTTEERSLVDRFLGEAKSAARLKHPNIVTVYESGSAGELLYIASEFVHGVTLASVIVKEIPAFQRSGQWIRDLALAVDYAHQNGVIHRDIKPGNIMIGSDGRPQLMDFGLAKREGDDATATRDGTILGTPAYMAPEQARGDLKGVGPSSDQYSLGVVLYELITGKRPFEGTSHAVISSILSEDAPLPRRWNKRIPLDLEAICLKAIAKDPRARYRSAREFADDLDRFLSFQPIVARRVSKTERLVRWAKRHRMWIGASFAVLLAITFTILLYKPKPVLVDAPPATPDTIAAVVMSSQKLHSLGLALHNYHDSRKRIVPHAVYDANGKPLLSWRVLLLPYLDQATLYQKFKLDEPWDSPTNKPLLTHMPDIYRIGGNDPSEDSLTHYQVFIGPGAPFEDSSKFRIGLSDLNRFDGASNTIMIVESKQGVLWTKPDDLPFVPDRPLPELGLTSEGFHACMGDGAVKFFRKSAERDDKFLRAAIGYRDSQTIRFPDHEGYPVTLVPKRGASTRPPEAELITRLTKAKNHLKQVGLAMAHFDNSQGYLPKQAIMDLNGKPLLSWRVAILPYIDQAVLYKKFHLDEPWDSDHNKQLLSFIPEVFAPTDNVSRDPGLTFVQVFVGKDTPLLSAPRGNNSMRLISSNDGLGGTFLVVEGGEPVPWTKPQDLVIPAEGPFPKLGGLYEDGFHALFCDQTVRDISKEIYDDEFTLRSLAAFRDGELVDVKKYFVRFDEKLRAGMTMAPGVKSAMGAAHRARSANNFKQLTLAMRNFYERYQYFPPAAIRSKDGKPLLSWRVALLPYLEQQLLYSKFHLNEPWDSDHNRKLLRHMPEIFEMPGDKKDEPNTTHYQVLVGTNAGFDPNVKKLNMFRIKDGARNTIMLAEATKAVPWTKPQDIPYEPNKPLTPLGFLSVDSFHVAMFDGSVFLLGAELLKEDQAFRTLIEVNDGKKIDLSIFRR